MTEASSPGPAKLARCTGDPACAWRFPTPRDCGQHASSDGNVFAAAEAMGIDLTPDGRGRDQKPCITMRAEHA
jgi:hypothetical protein